MLTPSPARRSKLSMFPTPMALNTKKNSAKKEKTSPRLVLFNMIEKVKRRVRKNTVKNNTTFFRLSGGVRKISEIRVIQRMVVRISVGRKFFLLLSFSLRALFLVMFNFSLIEC